jgi:outer membrane lipoprotein-sorting protein
MTRIGKTLTKTFWLILAAPLAVAAAPSPLDQVSAHLRAVQTMTASFTQTDRNGRAMTGSLLLKRPGSIRFQYPPSTKMLVVGDGKALTVIDYAVNQVSRWPIGDSPLSVLLDPKADLARVAKPVPSQDPNVLVIQARDPKHPEFGVISIGFTKRGGAPGGLMLEGWSVVDAQGNRSTVRLANQQFNVPISDKAFRWNDPRPRGPK